MFTINLNRWGPLLILHCWRSVEGSLKGCRDGTRTRACRTASRRSTVWAAPHPKFIFPTFFACIVICKISGTYRTAVILLGYLFFCFSHQVPAMAEGFSGTRNDQAVSQTFSGAKLFGGEYETVIGFFYSAYFVYLVRFFYSDRDFTMFSLFGRLRIILR